MRIAVTGKTGQVAQCLADTQPSGMSAAYFGRGEMDLSIEAFDLGPLEAFGPDLVINAAAYTAVDKAEEERDAAYALNCLAPGRLADFCAGKGIPLIHISTDYVFDGSSAEPYSEDDATNPLNVYGASKLDGEKAVQGALEQHVILRTSWVYSPYGHNFVKTMLRLGKDRDQLTIVDDQRGSPTSAHDLAAVIWSIADDIEKGRDIQWGLYHFAGGGEGSWADFAIEIFSQAGGFLPNKPSVSRIATADYPTPAKRPLDTVMNCKKAEDAFRLQRADWRDSLRQVIQRLEKEVVL